MASVTEKTRVCQHCGRVPEAHVLVTQGQGEHPRQVCPTAELKTVCPMCCRAVCQCDRIFSKPGTIAFT